MHLYKIVMEENKQTKKTSLYRQLLKWVSMLATHSYCVSYTLPPTEMLSSLKLYFHDGNVYLKMAVVSLKPPLLEIESIFRPMESWN